jgi:hypothetical protein
MRLLSLPWVAFATFAMAAPALGAPCSVPGTHASVGAALADPACNPISVATGDHLVSASIDRAVTVSGAGSNATRLYSGQAGASVLILLPNADVLLEGLALLVEESTSTALALSTSSGAQVSLSDVAIGNAATPATPLVFSNGFE